MPGKRGKSQYGGKSTSRNPYSRGGGSAWARSSQGARANAHRNRRGRGMTEAKLYSLKKGDELDKKFGFTLLPELLEQEEEARKEQQWDTTMDGESPAKLGWLLNQRSCTMADPIEGKNEVSGLELYFLEQDGKAFKTRIIYQPYFYVRPEVNRSQEVLAYCLRQFEGLVAKAERVFREDLDKADHLNGKKALYVKLSFATVSDLMVVKRELTPLVARNQERLQTRQAYDMQGQAREQVTEDDLVFKAAGGSGYGPDENESFLIELREYDVPYPMRVAIDLNVRVGAWYRITYNPTAPYSPSDVIRLTDMVDKAEPVVCAFDIECTKAPLKFPDAQVDQIYMISYMIDRQGYLIVNREFVSEEIHDFEYTPKAEYPGPFILFNEPNEEKLLKRFFEHVIEEKPHIFVTYNGDFFDWPFIDARAQVHGINMAYELGISLDERSGEYRGRCSVHMDAFCWVKRDSYLPQGSQGLKAVTKYKLGYDPVEVDAEHMLALARDEPMKMASYSVSDAVATFYLYDKYVHLFVFSLCTIIPLGSEDVLRKGSGTLCEALLMVEAFNGNIICPNKESSGRDEVFYKGHLIENETYVGGHVECLESGVFRADFLYDFQLEPSAFQQLIDHIDRDLQFSLEVEMNVPVEQVTNYEEVKKTIADRLAALRDRPNRKEQPLIYHLDVAAMYPNIILTNRLQPCAIVNEADCAACTFNTECGRAAIKDKEAACQREMEWVWRGDFYPATRPEYYSIKTQIEYENFPMEYKGGGLTGENAGQGFSRNPQSTIVPFAQLASEKQELLLKQRFKSYCSSVYKKTKVTEEQKRSATVCMRENPFYVNTVRAFRDRRYEYKGLTKGWKKKVTQAAEANDLLAKIDAQNKCLVYDSLQLAHKCILNSFYGYVMRKGARWHSMEMAGIVTHTGSSIITGARKLVEQIGRPLELDTDGIWAILPKSFPENFSFKLINGSTKTISYPCVMLNADVNTKFTNQQYHELDAISGKYTTHSECSILFEVDGPYKAMVLPASTEEGRLLKKRYAVFNFDHSLAELKGFELKRRGELQLIKAFQSQVFECFLDGANLEECYASVAKCANRWLDVIDTRGKSMDTDELMALITENKSMSGKLAEYEGQKSTSITTAKRLGEFLGEDMIKDKGLTCKMIIAARPYGEKVTERAIPTAIFATEDAVMKHFLKKWLRDPHLQDFDIRSILDWDYYRTRFASTVQKIISLPAAFQNVRNPVPRIALPDWMRKQVREKNAKHQQGHMKQFFSAITKGSENEDYVAQLIDMEDFTIGKQPACFKKPHVKRKRNKCSSVVEDVEDSDDADNLCVSKVKLGEVPFAEWLKNRKKMWKFMLRKRRREREERMRSYNGVGGFGMANSAHGSAKRFQNGTSSASASKGNGVGMENFVFDAGSALQREYWQIVEIQQELGGLFTCWVLTAHSQMLQRITLKLPRIFYIDCDETDHAHFLSLVRGSRRVSRIVPHVSSKPQQLLEVILSEGQYQQFHKEIHQILSDPHVKGVYELHVSALTRAVCALGCVAKVVNPHVSTIKQEYELSDLQLQSTAQVPYLMDLQPVQRVNATSAPLSTSLLRRVLLYFAQQHKRAILGLVVLKEQDEGNDNERQTLSEGDAHVWYVDPVSNVKSRNTELSQSFQQILVEAQAEGLPASIQSCSFTTHVVKTAQEAFSGVNATLARLASNKQLVPKPTIVVAQTSIPSSNRLREKIQGLHSFPIAMLPWNTEDTLFPALTWRKLMGEKMLLRWFEMISYYADVVDCARYAHLPVGNFTGDHSIAILDTLYSRILTKHKHLWWHSPTSLPDLGGKEQEQQFQQLFSQSLLGAAHQTTSDAVSQHRVDTSVVVCDKGSFVEVCVELELDGLAVNAILVASQIHSIEGIGGAHQMELDFNQAEDTGTAPAMAIAEGDAEESCHEAFRLLRIMVTTLFKDFLASQNKFADHLLQHFYRWVSSPDSLCFDPALYAMVKRLMEKLFLQLLAEFRRLGAQIVYADFSKLIVCTKKESLHDANAYMNFILQTVLSNELFQVLTFTPTKCVSNLLFLDAENYGCVLLQNIGPHDNKDKSDCEDHEHESKPLNIVAHWNMANYLPRGVDDYFLILVGQFIRRRAEFSHSERQKIARKDTDEIKDDDDFFEKDAMHSSPLARYSQKLVASYFSDKLLRLLPEILRHQMNQDSFPIFVGSHLAMESPALELVKFVTAVFELEPSVEIQVGKMRRMMLKVLHTSEFSDAAQFRNPSLSFTVQDVICLNCNLCHSVDLCRDPQLFRKSTVSSSNEHDDEEIKVAIAKAWHCPRCFALYNVAAFEMRLVELIQAQSVAYQLQDLYCIKCHLPAEHKMREYCPCSGTYALMPGVRESFLETLRLLKRIAQQHHFEQLKEAVQRLGREAVLPLQM
ncbi:hypothetical protein CCR75_003841 [Bremia lactucae]|uniref:DNA polymerase epsilon catalytic subunit n=1 Tax=Bremia lactucae TaxID=4779 RepID=A0A976NZU9_BRELC|nr:hypothetical protein CCR75_003841 [Bremia lactucae]